MWTGAVRPDPTATTLGPIFGPLDMFRPKLTVFNGLNMVSRDHGPGGDGHHRGVPHMLTCTEMVDSNNAGGPSVDQKIAGVIGTGTTFPSLQFAVRIVYGDTNSALIWGGASQRLPTMQDPWAAYARIFGGQTGGAGAPPTNGTGAPAASGAPVSAPPTFDLRKSALDHALAEITTLRNKLPAADRVRLDSYQTSLRDIEKRLTSVPMVGTRACATPMLGPETLDPKAEPDFPKIGKLQMDLIVAALRCDVTRVASLQWSNSVDQCAYSWLGVNRLGHDLAHSGDSKDKQTVFNWYSQQFAYLLGQLQAVPEGRGTMLDNTVVLWVSEFSESNGHRCDDLVWLLMGNAGGFFKQGRVLMMNGRSVNDVHATITKAFGIPDAKFGNPVYCTGPIADIIA
jgi:hypothetical protein